MTAPRLFRLLLRCYPRAFREEFGEEMCATFARLLRETPDAAGRAGLWAGAFTESLVGGFRERLSPHSLSVPDHTPNRSSTSMDRILQDLRFSARALRRRPVLVGTVVVTLSLGIGAMTAIFSLVDAVLLNPVPVHRPATVVAAYHRLNASTPHEAFPYPLYRHLAGDSTLNTIESLAGYHVIEIGALVAGRMEQVQVAGVSGNFFGLLGLTAQAGRLFHAADDGPIGANPIVVLSDDAWVRYYGRDPAAVGKTIRAGGIPYTIVGVAPPRFRGTDLSASPQLWFPIQMSTSLGEGGLFSNQLPERVYDTEAFGWVELIGRMRSGATATAVAGELNARTLSYWRERRAAAAGRDSMTAPVSVVSLATSAAIGDRDTLVRFVTLLSVVVVLVLLIACVNVANLLLLRGNERLPELALRGVLGASRARLTRQALLESLLLAALGAVVGVGVGLIVMQQLATFALPGGVAIERIDLGLNTRVLVFTAMATGLVAVLVGLVPSLRAGQAGTAAGLRAFGGNSGRGSHGILVIAQTAMSAFLLVGAALFIRSLQSGLRTDLGMDPRGLAAATVDLGLFGYTPERKVAYYAEAVERARSIPGVQGAAIGSHVPLARLNRLPMTPIGGVPTGENRTPRIGVGLVHVSPEYFDVIGVPLRTGRGFTASDDAASERVAIVNESAARRLAPNRDIVGLQVSMMGVLRYRVVGIVADTKYSTVADSAIPVMFTPVTQPTGSAASLIVRSAAPGAVLPELTRLLRSIDPDVPPRDVRLVVNQVNSVLMPQRFGATLLGALAFVALAISIVGIYGVVSYGVSRRSRELGIRIALGAGGQHITQVVALRSVRAASIGIALGVAGAALASRGMEPFLVGITRLDLAAFASSALVLIAAAAMACWGPVRRALRVDPMRVIRSD